MTCRKTNYHCSKFLLFPSDNHSNQKDRDDQTPDSNVKTDEKRASDLIEEAKNGNIVQMERLLDEGVSPNVLCGGDKYYESGHEFRSNSWTPLHAAVDKNQKKAASFLLTRGATVNIRDHSGRTPLHIAASNDSQGLISLLLERGANVNSTDKRGRTPYHRARLWGKSGACNFLKQHGGKKLTN